MRQSLRRNAQRRERFSAWCVSDSSEIDFTEDWAEYCQEVPTGSRRRTICRKSARRKVTPWEFCHKVDNAVEAPTLCRTSSSEVVQIFLKKTWKFACTTARDLHNNIFNVKGTCVQACEKSSDLSTGQLKRKLWYLGQTANTQIETLWWAVAHLNT